MKFAATILVCLAGLALVVSKPGASSNRNRGLPVESVPGTQFECDPENNGAFPHEHCEKYWDCYDGMATLMTCPGDHLFETVWFGCSAPELVDCGDRIRPTGAPPTDGPDPTTHAATEETHEPSTEGPIETTEWPIEPSTEGPISTTQEPVEPSTEGPISTTQEPIEPSTEGPIPTTQEPVDPSTQGPTDAPGFQCPIQNGNFPDPEDCGSFYQCSNFIPYHQRCPLILLYHPENELCDFPDMVDCGTRPIIPPTSN